MVLKCSKCNNTFNSEYVLNKHLNRKIPCDTILQCTRCDKVFKTIRDLNSHENRKFPCKITDLNFESEQREKDRELKLHLETEKNIRKDQAILIEQQKLDMRDKEAAARAANLQLQMEIAQLKCNSKLELAQALQNNKVAFKEQYPSSVTNITNITNIFINNIKDTYLDTTNLCFTQIAKHRHKMFNTTIRQNNLRMYTGKNNWFIDVFNQYNSSSDMIKHFLRHAYSNDTELNTRCIFYHNIIKQFYAIYIKDDITNNRKDVKQLQLIDYDKDLHEEFISCIKEYVTGMLNGLKDQNHCDPNNIAHTKSINTIIDMEKLIYILNSTKKFACSVLDISNEDANATKLKHIKYKEDKIQEKIKRQKKKENKPPNIFPGMTTSESE